ncbi:MAG: hypothetical protein IJ719_23420 [Clostridia bacterium]|nr:hypothetical protein [Clostridia bacterium]
MSKYSVPESIRQMKPKGTMVKCISGHYYVYEYSTVTGADGKRHTEMRKAKPQRKLMEKAWMTVCWMPAW